MRTNLLSAAVTSILAVGSTVAQAQLAIDAILTIDGDGSSTGSFFTMGGGTSINSAGFDGQWISGLNGLTLGVLQTSSGSHGGGIDGSENPDVDNPWLFFGNTGMHGTEVTAPTIISASGNTALIDFSGWRVTWNGVESPGINMGNNAWRDNNQDGTVDASDNGVASVTCAQDCSAGDTYVLEYSATVPDDGTTNFGNVQYLLHLEGTVLPNSVPIANDDNAKSITDNPVTVDVLANDQVAPDPTTVAVVGAASNGNTSENGTTGEITYTPNASYNGPDSFDYTVKNAQGTSNTATVSITVAPNTAVVANDDSATTNTAVLGNSPLTISVLDNDEDTDNVADQPGGIDTSSLTIIQDAATGTCSANPDGTISYSQSPVAAVTDTCVYRVSDLDSANTPTSDTATVTINVVELTSNWPQSIASDIIPILDFEPGVAGANAGVRPQSGSFFSMQVDPQTGIFVPLEPGPAGGLIIGHEQPGGTTHSGPPNGTELTSVDQPWVFFGNTGIHYTRNGGITGNTDGTLQFHNVSQGKGAWIVSWNSIPAIDMGGDLVGTNSYPPDLGFGTITCTPTPCADGSSFTLEYEAHVPPGDPSGFGQVPYALHMVGTVRFLDANAQTSDGTISSLSRLQASEVTTEDPDVNFSCAGNCFEYTITGVTATRVSLVLPLAGGVPESPVWRILDNGEWRSFDTSTGDSIASAPFDTGTGQCPAPGDAAYGELTVGHQCVQLAISDNGPNDLNAAVGTISDPGGLGSGGTAGGGTDFVDTRTSDTGGCSLGTGRNAGLEWLLIGMLLIGLGLGSRRRA